MNSVPPVDMENSVLYRDAIRALQLPSNASILVVCGGHADKESLLECGFSDVTISNLDDRIVGDEFAPYAWSYQDLESLTYPDNSFDYCMVHDGLHHCASPHRGLLEMFRVARRGILVCESRDSILMRIAVGLKRIPMYELDAVRANDFKWGGVRNSCVPNFVYRWTEREVRKTVYSYAPYAPHDIRFFYGLRVPRGRLPFRSSKYLGWIASLSEMALNGFFRMFRKQGNSFAFYVGKGDDKSLFPWLKSRDEFNREYVGKSARERYVAMSDMLHPNGES